MAKKKRPPDLGVDWYDPAKAAEAVVAESGRFLTHAWTYGMRDVILQQIGYSSYGDYLESDLWHQIRALLLRDRRRCWVCHRRRKATQVHHQEYTRRNLLGETSHGLKPVCRICHRCLEFRREGGKLTFKQAQLKARKLRKWKKWPAKVRQAEKTLARHRG